MTIRQHGAQPRQHGLPATYRYEKLVESHFTVGIKTGPEWMVQCLWHENTGSPAMQVNVESGLFVCFNEDCGKRGNARTLLREFGENFQEPEVDVSEIVARLNALDTQSGKGPAALPPIPETMVKRYAFNATYWGPHSDECDRFCREHRGFTTTTIGAFDLGFDLMNDAATIGLRNHYGQLIGFIKRSMDPNAMPRYRNPKGFVKSQALYASWLAAHAQTDTLVVVEGPVDAIAVWQAGYCAVAQFGSSMSAQQIRLIRRMGFGRIVTFYDNDKAGKAATASAQGEKHRRKGGKVLVDYNPTLDLRRDFLVAVAKYPDGPANDPGSMDSLDLISAIEEATNIS